MYICIIVGMYNRNVRLRDEIVRSLKSVNARVKEATHGWSFVDPDL